MNEANMQLSPSIAGLLLALLVWRVWKFHLKPALYPNDPKELPYWIPGHAIGFWRNSFDLLYRGRQYFGNTGEPFAITVAGQSIYVLTSPDDIEELYKNKTTLSWEFFVQKMYRWIGFSEQAIEKLWRPPTEQQKALNPVRTLSPNEMVSEYQRRQLRPGKKADVLARSMVDHIDGLLQWRNLSMGQSTTRIRRGSEEEAEESQSLSLMEWTTSAFVRSTTEIYWGQKMLETDPTLLHTYATWERTSWKFIFQLPRLFSRDMCAAREKLVDAFAAYFRIPQAERADAAWFVPIAEAEMRDIGLDETDLGRAHMLQHWAINGNMHKVTFWIMAHILHTPALLDAIREETAPAVVDDSPDIPYLLEHCPRLEAIYHEVLRLQMSNSLMRHVTEPTLIGGKLLQPGRNVLMPYRILHYDPAVWGADAAVFDADRFLRRKEMARDPNYRPFGGGQHMCPGRFVAKQAIFAFVALTLSRFHVRLEGDDEEEEEEARDGSSGGGCGGGKKEVGCRQQQRQQRFPRPEDLKPGLSTLGPRKGDEVLVRCSIRESNPKIL